MCSNSLYIRVLPRFGKILLIRVGNPEFSAKSDDFERFGVPLVKNPGTTVYKFFFPFGVEPIIC